MGDAKLASHGPLPNHRLPGPPALAPPRRGVREGAADRRAGLPPDRAAEGGEDDDGQGFHAAFSWVPDRWGDAARRIPRPENERPRPEARPWVPDSLGRRLAGRLCFNGDCRFEPRGSGIPTGRRESRVEL